jgi:lipopolysaccharide transport system permease protein
MDKSPTILPVTVYSPESQLRHPRKMLRSMLTDLWLARELAWRLAIRDINVKYRQALLGLAWALILPLINTATWILLNNSGVVSVSDTQLPYPVYVFTGTMLWQIFVEAFQSPNEQVNAAKGMLSKVKFPIEAIILSGILQTLFNAAIKLLLLIIALLFFGIKPGLGILLLPVGVFALILTGITLGLILAPIGALYQDVGKITLVITQFWMYITPVVFSPPKNGLAATLFQLNPLTPIILTSRDWLTGGSPMYLLHFLLVIGVMMIILFAGWVLYRISMPILIERMNA